MSNKFNLNDTTNRISDEEFYDNLKKIKDEFKDNKINKETYNQKLNYALFERKFGEKMCT